MKNVFTSAGTPFSRRNHTTAALRLRLRIDPEEGGVDHLILALAAHEYTRLSAIEIGPATPKANQPYCFSSWSNSLCAIDRTPGSVSFSAFSISLRPGAVAFPMRVSPIMAFCRATGYESCKPRR